MGAKLVTNKPSGAGSSAEWVNCKTDSDCYGTWSGVTASAGTDAEKKLRCCQYVELLKPADTPVGKGSVTTNNTSYGWPTVKDTYTKTCNADYKT